MYCVDQQNWKVMLKQMKYDYLERTAPSFFAASGGRTMKIIPYKDDTANGFDGMHNGLSKVQ
jgi:hypothetical protein